MRSAKDIALKRSDCCAPRFDLSSHISHRSLHHRPDTRVRSNAPSVEAKRLIPLPKEDLVAYLKSGCKPKTDWRCAWLHLITSFKKFETHLNSTFAGKRFNHGRIGTEHEKLGFNLGDNSRMSYAQIEAMLRKLESRFGWSPIIEDGRYLTQRCMQTITWIVHPSRWNTSTGKQ